MTHSLGDAPFSHTLYYKWEGYPGYQHTATDFYNRDGVHTGTAPPPVGYGDTYATSLGAPITAVARCKRKPTLKVEIDVEENLVPPAVAGSYTFPQNDDYAGGQKYYTSETDIPGTSSDLLTELIAVTLDRNDGFVLKSWTGNCAYYDANGNYLGMLPVSVPDDPDDWITGDTIYVKCLKANPTQMASAMTGMAVLAGATTEGAIPPAAFTAVSAQVQAQVEFAPNPVVGIETVMVDTAQVLSCETPQDDYLLNKVQFDSQNGDITRYVKVKTSPWSIDEGAGRPGAYPGEIFKLTITDPVAPLIENGLKWKWTVRSGEALHHIEDIQPVSSAEGDDPIFGDRLLIHKLNHRLCR